MAIMLITHNLGVVAEMADDVVVMYLGRVVEQGAGGRHLPRPEASLHAGAAAVDPEHRLEAAGRSCRRSAARSRIPYNRPPGCPFHPRCASVHARAAATPTEPALVRRSATVSKVSCFLYEPASEPRHDVPACDDPDQMLLEVKGLQEVLPDPQGLAAEGRRPGAGRRRRHLLHQPGRDAVAGRRERLRQDDDVALHPARDRPDRRADPASDGRRRGRSTWRRCPKTSCGRCAAQMQMIFQDPFSSLNPRMTLLDIVGEPLLVNGDGQPRRSARTGSPSCCGWSGCGPSTCAATRTPSAAASASASASPARWR